MAAIRQKIRLPPLPTIRDLLQLYGLRALKQLSQNFLLDRRITKKIARTMGNVHSGHVVEVGPGPGSITRPIIEMAPKKLILIEKDKRFQPTLELLGDATNDCEVIILNEDILRMNMETLFPEKEKRAWVDKSPNIHIIGNLPFNVATPLIIQWLHDISLRQNIWRYGRVKLTLTFQKEVAERLAAPILSKQRCRLSMMAQNWCCVNHVFNIPGSAFIPKPDVDVGVVKMEPLIRPAIDSPFPFMEKVVRVMFSGKQKYVKKTLGNLFPRGDRDELVERLLKDADIPSTSRAIQITLPELGRVIHAYNTILSERPSIGKYNFREDKDIEVDYD